MAAEIALCIADLSVTAPSGERVLDGISLCVARSQLLVVLGESGSGKSLLAAVAAGVLPEPFVVAGTVRLFGCDLGDPAQARAAWGRRVLLLPQEPKKCLVPTARVGRLVAEPWHHVRGLAWREARVRARDSLQRFGLDETVPGLHPHALSGGMAQRVLAAHADASPAPFLIFDEPTKGLDPSATAAIAAQIEGLLGQGRAVLLITHDLDLVARLDADAVVLRSGRLVERLACRAFAAADARHPYVRSLALARPELWPERRRYGSPPQVLRAEGLRVAPAARRPLPFAGEFTLNAGGWLGITGASGMGKTTLGDTIIGLLRPAGGRVLWADGAGALVDPNTLGRRARRRLRPKVQKIHQDPADAFAPWATLADALEEVVSRLPDPIDARTRLERWRTWLGISRAMLARYPAEVSGGELQRIAILRALLPRPFLLVADEPTARLDPLTQKETVALLQMLSAEEGLAVVLIAHHRGLLAKTCAAILDLGVDGQAMRGPSPALPVVASVA